MTKRVVMMQRYSKPVSALGHHLHTSQYAASSELQWLLLGQTRQRHDEGRFSSSTPHRRWIDFSQSIPAPALACSINGRFLSTAATPSGGDGSVPEDNNKVCRLFREIGHRVDSAVRDRILPTSAPSGSSPATARQSAASLTSEFCKSYLSLLDNHPASWENDPKQQFIELLVNGEYDADEKTLLAAIDSARSHSLRSSDIHHIRELCTPRYESSFHYILGSAQQDLGVAFLVKLRKDIRDVVHYWKFAQRREEQRGGEGTHRNLHKIDAQQLSKLQTLERNIQTILTSLFRPGVLSLQRITYQETPASIIEQIAFKEAVHPLQSLDDLRTRLGPGRRCFAFFHPSLPNKPLVFVHVALLQDIPESMEDLQYAAECNATCATFYSITNTEPGLAGVDLGNHLIKSVVQVLRQEFPKLDTFCTLSPIPKFRKWLEGKVSHYNEGLLREKKLENGNGEGSFGSFKFMDDDLLREADVDQLRALFAPDSYLHDLLDTLKSPNWHTTPDGGTSALAEQLQPVLMRLAAYYLTVERHHGRPLCPVAKFHIRNGSEMYRLNYMADTSPKGTRNNCGMMINYRYVLNEIEENRVMYEIGGNVKARDGVKCWLDRTGQSLLI